MDTVSGELTALFNPRTQNWSDHFVIDAGRITPLTASGRVTEVVLKLNLPSRVEVREVLANIGRYPART